MKKNFMRIIALILTVASLVSMLTVFAWAADEDISDDTAATNPVLDFEEADDLIYNRTFEDGWGASNGAALSGVHNVTIDYEETVDYSYNYFTRFEYTKELGSTLLEFAYKGRMLPNGYDIIGLSVKADDACVSGTIANITIGQSGIKQNLLIISDSKLYAFNTSPENYICSLADGVWNDVEIVLDWNDKTQLFAYAYLNGEAVVEFNLKYGGVLTSGINVLYIGLPDVGTPDERAGKSFCLDNLRIYQGVDKPIDTSKYGYGIFVDTVAEKTVEIRKSANEKNAEQILAESLGMKVGVPSALLRNEKIDISDYFTPTIVDGNIMVSLRLIVEALGYPYYVHSGGNSYDIAFGANSNAYVTVGRSNATVNGKLVDLDVVPAVANNDNGEPVVIIAIDDIEKIFPGWIVTYDNMGLIIVYEDISEGDTEGESEGLINRKENLDSMLDMMKKFVFDTVTVDEDGKALSESASYTATGESILGAAAEAQHPYIYANQSTFDNLKGIYAAADGDANLKAYIAKMVAKADAYYNEVADESGATVTIKAGKEPLNVYQDNIWPDFFNPEVVSDTDDGYNPTTKALYEIEEFSEQLVYLAFAYQVTGDSKYAELAYEASVVLGEWVHWGPGYFINCATATNNFAVAYDWLYNVYLDTYGEAAVEALAQVIYDRGLSHGYNSSVGEFCKFPRTAGYGDAYTNRTDSWNAIGTAGMVIGALAILGTDAYEANKAQIDYLVGNNVINLANVGLDRYAPDGSYIESVTYWAKHTNAFMQLIMALVSATGDDFGFKDAWGIESTFYYACQIENSNGEAWNYHEDGVGSIIFPEVLTADTQMFNFAGQLLGDQMLVAIRQQQLAKGKEATLFDILFYPFEPVDVEIELELDYYMEAIDAFVSRSDWEDGALYVGIMGGLNAYSPYGEAGGDDVFGQIDSGNFIYQNGGVNWIIDHGSDYFTLDDYYKSSRFEYYRNSGEGHNIVLYTSSRTNVPYGQVEAADGNMYETYIDPNGKGSYAVINNSNAYGSASQGAYRGMLITNDKQTVVIQDEIALKGITGNFAWVVNTAQEIILSDEEENPKTAYLKNVDEEGNELYLRATLISNMDYKFEVLKSDASNIMTSTRKDDNSVMGRGDTQRLIIRGEEQLSFNVAVVFEMVDFPGSDMEVGYEWLAISSWSNAFSEEETSNNNLRGTPVRQDIITLTALAEIYIDDETAFTNDLYDFFVTLATVAYTIRAFPNEDEGAINGVELTYRSSQEDFEEMEELYLEFAEIVNETEDELRALAQALSGR